MKKASASCCQIGRDEVILIRDHRPWVLRAAIQAGRLISLSASDRDSPRQTVPSGTRRARPRPAVLAC